MSLERLMLTRARIAHFGEKGQQNWWPSEAHSRAGGLLLNRLFPRTAPWTAVELAMDAAGAAHRRALPAIPVYTLFDLGVQVNRALSDLLLQKKQSGEPADEYVAPVNSLGELVNAEMLDAVMKFAEDHQPDRAIQVGEVHPDADLTDPTVWEPLVAGYRFSSPGRLVLPYLVRV